MLEGVRRALEEIDIQVGVSGHDLANKSAQEAIFGWISSGGYDGVTLSPPLRDRAVARTTPRVRRLAPHRVAGHHCQFERWTEGDRASGTPAFGNGLLDCL